METSLVVISVTYKGMSAAGISTAQIERSALGKLVIQKRIPSIIRIDIVLVNVFDRTSITEKLLHGICHHVREST